MPEKSLAQAAILMAVLVVVIIGAWEIYLRHTGITISYDNGKELWADKRAKVYGPPDKTTVFLGSSRIKYDLDIPTWEQTTGRQAIQLASEGSNPIPVLIDLSNDPLFKGKLVVDITEQLFFSPLDPGGEKQGGFVAYYKSRTPAQRVSFMLDHALESQLVFLDQDFLSLNAGLDKLLPVRDRPEVYKFPDFPLDFSRCSFDRQSWMSDKFLADTNLQVRVQKIWLYLGNRMRSRPAPKENPIPGIMQTVKTAVDKIRARGGEVVFVRTPSSGPMWMMEQHAFPREKLWDPLLAQTHSTGIYFADYPELSHFICPEWSHLKASDAIVYTQKLEELLPGSFTGLTKNN